MNTIENVKSKIRAMLNLAADDAAAAGEVANALRFAERLMAEHNLSESDLDAAEEKAVDLDRAERGEASCHTGSTKCSMWEDQLAGFVREFVGGVGCYVKGRPETVRGAVGVKLDSDGNPKLARAIVFYGLAEDAQLAAELYSEICHAIAAMSRLRYGTVYRGSGREYCEGFVRGLFEAMWAERKDRQLEAQHTSDSKALTLIDTRAKLVRKKQAIARDYLRSKGVRLGSRSGRSGPVTSDPNARAQGNADGRSYGPTAQRKPKLTN